MDSYKLSKAWHLGQELMIDVHTLAKQIPAGDRFRIAPRLRQTSAMAPMKIAQSLEREMLREKLECYQAVRRAMVILHEDLTFARDCQYIAQETFLEVAGKAISIHQLLTPLIRKLKQDIALAE